MSVASLIVLLYTCISISLVLDNVVINNFEKYLLFQKTSMHSPSHGGSLEILRENRSPHVLQEKYEGGEVQT